MIDKKNDADSIAFSVEIGLVTDKNGSYRKSITEKLDAFEKEAKEKITQGAAPKEFAKLSKLLQAIPAAKEIIDLYQPIKNE